MPLHGYYGSALAAAAYMGQLEVVRFLVDKGASIDLPLQGNYGRALAAAACMLKLDLFQFLVDKVSEEKARNERSMERREELERESPNKVTDTLRGLGYDHTGVSTKGMIRLL
ncbi:ankyrin repeat-containing domain protein [Penicillium herquei]|nr:ankyrin repeat-containing domain protein [Penicillium herquei]